MQFSESCAAEVALQHLIFMQSFSPKAVLQQTNNVASCFSPYRAPEAPGVEIPEKWGKITKFPSPVQPPKMGKNYRKNTKKVFSEYFLVIFR